MTFREWAERYCTERGLSKDAAMEVVDAVGRVPEYQVLIRRCDPSVDACPEPLRLMLVISIGDAAIEYIDRHGLEPTLKSRFSLNG